MKSVYQRDAYIAACSIEKISKNYAEAVKKVSNNNELNEITKDYFMTIKRTLYYIETLGISLENSIIDQNKQPIGFHSTSEPNSQNNVTTKSKIGF